jgi:cytochrome d ubiquinol oxidase subunit II
MFSSVSFDITLIWAGIIAFAVFMYVMLDGFDLGLGILFPFARRDEDRDLMMNSAAPIWDGNETWLVWGVRPCSAPSRWPTRSCCRPSTCRSS